MCGSQELGRESLSPSDLSEGVSVNVSTWVCAHGVRFPEARVDSEKFAKYI